MNNYTNKNLDKKSIHDSFMQEINGIIELCDRYPFEDKEAYGYFLNQQYFLIRYSTRLLALSASVIDTTDSKEFRWWATHLQEEIDHDLTILNDMKAIGYTFSKQCEPVVRGLSLALFEDIRVNGQDSLLGYALMLEGFSMKRCQILSNRVKKAYGKGFSYLKLHAVADEKHFPQGIERISSFPEHRKQVILDNLSMSGHLYRNFLSTISRRYL